MTDISKTIGGPQPNNFATWNPIALVQFPIGTPVTGSLTVSDTVVPASGINGSGDLNFVSGFATTPGNPGLPVQIRYYGPITLTTQEWDLITGQLGGLTLGQYYLSNAAAGKIQSGIPEGPIVIVGRAVSPTTLVVQSQNL
jgi:hypothetical protein